MIHSVTAQVQWARQEGDYTRFTVFQIIFYSELRQKLLNKWVSGQEEQRRQTKRVGDEERASLNNLGPVPGKGKNKTAVHTSITCFRTLTVFWHQLYGGCCSGNFYFLHQTLILFHFCSSLSEITQHSGFREVWNSSSNMHPHTLNALSEKSVLDQVKLN